MSSLLKSLAHPSEVWSLLEFQLFGGKEKLFPPNDISEATPTMRRCYEFLNLTSRSFAAVIQALHSELRPAICIFYLVLRGLDTVEDDMTIPLATKVPELRAFHTRLQERGWRFSGCGPKEKDRALLEEFNVVIDEFQKLKPAYQVVISDICMKMGNGMADFADRGHVDTIEEYNLYCHYVAGLVGIGLSQLFSASSLEDEEVGKDTVTSNSMGLFLQKTNIIRDYLDDLTQGRTWWPKQVWEKYSQKLEHLALKSEREKAIACLNELVTDAMQHAPDVFKYMSRLRNPTVFAFCAIPQVMAIATLALCFNNGNVFEKVVKIRKGLTVQLMLQSTNMGAIYSIFDRFVGEFEEKIAASGVSVEGLSERLHVVKAEIETAKRAGVFTEIQSATPSSLNTVLRTALVAGVAAAAYYSATHSNNNSH